jgi:uncharacterized membrane protein
MSDTGKQDVTTRPGRGLRIVLAVSLGLNLLVAGIVAGTILQDGPPHRLESVRDLGFGPFSEALTSADRTALRQDFLDRANDMRAMRDGMRREAEALLIVLRAEPFDPEALRTQMAHMVSRMGERVALGQDLLADHLAQMSPDDRQAFADRFEKSLRKGHGLRAGHRD